LRSFAGWYIGRLNENNEPYSRNSPYFRTAEEANEYLSFISQEVVVNGIARISRSKQKYEQKETECQKKNIET